MDTDGTDVKKVTNSQESIGSMQFTPDCMSIVYNGGDGLFLIDTTGTNLRRLTDIQLDLFPDVSPLGDRIIFQMGFGDLMWDIFIVDIDGNNRKRLTYEYEEWYPQFSPDGSTILYESNTVHGIDLFLMDIDGNNKINLTNNGGYDGMFSPDGTIMEKS
jgi:TolB protein